MESTNVKCNVCECAHNAGNCCCNLDCIEITHEKTQADAVPTPHFCKCYEEK